MVIQNLKKTKTKKQLNNYFNYPMEPENGKEPEDD